MRAASNLRPVGPEDISAIAILTFALGIGVNVTIFSVVDAIALRPLGVPDAGRIVAILNEDPAHPERGASSSWVELQALRTESSAFAGITAADRRAVMVREGDETRMLLTNVMPLTPPGPERAAAP